MNKYDKACIAVVAVIWTAVICITGPRVVETSFKEVDPALSGYFIEYKDLLTKHCPKYKPSNFYSITLGKPSGTEHWIGVCKPKLNGYSIVIDPQFFEYNSDNDNRQLMYHEFAHCIIDKDHNENDPNNYMYPMLNPLEHAVYLEQVTNDIQEFCKTI